MTDGNTIVTGIGGFSAHIARKRKNVIPAQAGIWFEALMGDPGLRRDDGGLTFEVNR